MPESIQLGSLSVCDGNQQSKPLNSVKVEVEEQRIRPLVLNQKRFLHPPYVLYSSQN